MGEQHVLNIIVLQAVDLSVTHGAHNIDNFE